MNEYGLEIKGPFEGLQDIQIALLIYRGLGLNLSFVRNRIPKYEAVCKSGVSLGIRLCDDSIFHELISTSSVSTEEVIDYMFLQLEKKE
jgi:hypothetical protein